jgi:hypothetical protein
LIDAIRSLPVAKSVSHCGREFTVSPFDFYGICPNCGTRIKLRSFSACPELVDVFDAVFEWLQQPGAESVWQRRQEELRNDKED